MNLLGIINEFSRRTALPETQIVFGSADNQLMQLAGLANEIVEDLLRRWNWQQLRKEAIIEARAEENQGSLKDIAPGCARILNDTIWDRDSRLPIYRENPQDWQMQQALNYSSPFHRYRIMDGCLYIYPAPAEGTIFAFEYQSNAPVVDRTDPDQPVYKEYFTRDTDEFLLPETLLIKGLRWRWKEEKGLPYMEPFRNYEDAVAHEAGYDMTKPKLSLNGGDFRDIKPAVLVPAGSWEIYK